MKYRKDRYKYYNIISDNECWQLNVNTGGIKRITNFRQIQSIDQFEISDKEAYESAYIRCLKINRTYFKEAIN